MKINACRVTIKNMENGPSRSQQRAEQRTGQAGGSPHADQQKNDFASVNISVKTQGVGKWLGNIFDEIEQNIDRPQQGIFAERECIPAHVSSRPAL